MAAFIGNAQEGPYPSSGIGIIVPDKGINERGLNFPLAKIGLFDAPGGTEVGFIIKKNSLNLMYQAGSNGFPYRVKDNDLAELAILGYCLKIFAIEGKFVQVLKNSTGRGYWISLDEIGYLRFSSRTWMEWMSTQKCLFYPMVDVGINLRTAPDAKSAKLELLKGRNYGITLTGKTDGYWAEVTVSRYSSPPCKDLVTTVKPLETKEGWVKILDDGGTPNIWFSPRGCK
jgi:hypothetical protein